MALLQGHVKVVYVLGPSRTRSEENDGYEEVSHWTIPCRKAVAETVLVKQPVVEKAAEIPTVKAAGG